MTPLIVAAVLILVLGFMLFEMTRTPMGIEREHRVEQHRIFSTTRTTVDASPEEAVRLLEGDWSWWKRGHAEPATDLGNGRKEFRFHPVRFFDLIEVPPAFVVRFDTIERTPDGGTRIGATLHGDFDGRAEYSVRPESGRTVVELTWRGAEPRNMFRFPPIAFVALVHCWRERLGMQGLRDRLQSRRSTTEPARG